MQNRIHRISFRCTDDEYLKIKSIAADHRMTMTEYIRISLQNNRSPGTFHCDLNALKELIALKADLGKATGMLKQAIASSKYNPKTFARLVKQYETLRNRTTLLIDNWDLQLRSLR